MNDKHTNHEDLHLHTDPETERIESLLDALGSQDREAMSAQRQERVLEGISKVFAPEPIAIDQAPPVPAPHAKGSAWRWRYAAAAALAMAATLGIVISQPWHGSAAPDPVAPNQGAWTLASFEQDLDAYMSMDQLETDTIDEAVANWEIWAQTIETEFDSDAISHEFGIADFQNGAL